MAEYLTRDSVEVVPLNSPVPFLDSIRCPNGNVIHSSGSGIFTLRGSRNGCFSRYEIEFTGNISIPTGGTVTPIATAIIIQGEAEQGSRAIYTPAAVDEYGNEEMIANLKAMMMNARTEEERENYRKTIESLSR